MIWQVSAPQLLSSLPPDQRLETLRPLLQGLGGEERTSLLIGLLRHAHPTQEALLQVVATLSEGLAPQARVQWLLADAGHAHLRLEPFGQLAALRGAPRRRAHARAHPASSVQRDDD